MSLTNRFDRPAHERCLACDRPLPEEHLHETGQLGEPLDFCDVRCFEQYKEGLALTELEGEDDREAA